MRNRCWFSLGALAVTIAAVVCAPAFVAAQAQKRNRRGHEGRCKSGHKGAGS